MALADDRAVRAYRAARDRVRRDALLGGVHRRSHDQRGDPACDGRRGVRLAAGTGLPASGASSTATSSLPTSRRSAAPPTTRRWDSSISPAARWREQLTDGVPERRRPRRAIRDVARPRHPSRAGRGRDHAPAPGLRAQHAGGDGRRADRLPRHGDGSRVLRGACRGNGPRGGRRRSPRSPAC